MFPRLLTITDSPACGQCGGAGWDRLDGDLCQLTCEQCEGRGVMPKPAPPFTLFFVRGEGEDVVAAESFGNKLTELDARLRLDKHHRELGHRPEYDGGRFVVNDSKGRVVDFRRCLAGKAVRS